MPVNNCAVCGETIVGKMSEGFRNWQFRSFESVDYGQSAFAVCNACIHDGDLVSPIGHEKWMLRRLPSIKRRFEINRLKGQI